MRARERESVEVTRRRETDTLCSVAASMSARSGSRYAIHLFLYLFLLHLRLQRLQRLLHSSCFPLDVVGMVADAPKTSSSSASSLARRIATKLASRNGTATSHLSMDS